MSETPEEVAERRESLVRLLRLYDSVMEQPTEHELRSGCRDAADALEDEMRRAKAAEERIFNLTQGLLVAVGRARAAEERVRKAEEERDELRDRLLEEHEGNPGREDARLWEMRAHEKEQVAAELRESVVRLRAEIARLERIIAAVPIDADEKGQAVKCSTCGLRKQPIGRSAPLEMVNGLCDDDCPGYREEPLPGDLWPGESRIDFGYPQWIAAIAAEQKRIRARDTSAILDHLGFEREEGA